jgi:hypothetical protein
MARKEPSQARLEEMIEEATVDCYSQEEAHVGLLTSLQDGITCPFTAKVIGEEVEVVELRSRASGLGVDALCRYKGKDYPIDILSLQWGKKKPEGYEWIEAYRLWLSGSA